MPTNLNIDLKINKFNDNECKKSYKNKQEMKKLTKKNRASLGE